MDVLTQLVVTVAFVTGILIVVGLCLFFLVLPHELERDDETLDRHEATGRLADDSIGAAPTRVTGAG